MQKNSVSEVGIDGSKNPRAQNQLYYLVSTFPGFIGPFLSVFAGIGYKNKILLVFTNLAWFTAGIMTLVLGCFVTWSDSDSLNNNYSITVNTSSESSFPPLFYVYLIIQTTGVACIFYAKPAILAWLKDDLAVAGAVLQSAQLVGSVGFYFVAVGMAEGR